MPDSQHDTRTLLRSPSAWLMGGMFLIGIGWIARTSPVGLVAACAVSAIVLYAVSSLALAREKSARLRDELRARRANEARVRTVLQHVPALMWRSGTRDQRFLVSAEWLRVTGVKAGELTADEWYDLVHAEDVEHCRSVARVAAVNREPYEVAFRLKTSDHRTHWMLERATPCLDDDGELLGFVGVTVDVTEQRSASAELLQRVEDLRKTNDTIARKARSLADEHDALMHERADAEDTHRVRGEYLNALTGEMQDAVNAVCRAMDGAAPQSADDRQEIASRAREGAGRLAALLERGSELAAAGTDPVDVEIEDVELRSVLEDVAGRLRERGRDRGIDAHVTIAMTVAERVQTDPRLVRRVLGALGATAIGVTTEGDVRISAHAEPSGPGRVLLRIELHAHAEKVDDAVLERAFYPATGVGPGLGLGGCRRDAEGLGGRAGVRRDSGSEIVFWFSVDVAEANPNARVHGTGESERGPIRLKSSLGPVLELSANGMRVRCRKALRDRQFVEIRDGDDLLVVTAEPMWSKRLGFRRFEAGLEFRDLEPEVARRLCRLASDMRAPGLQIAA